MPPYLIFGTASFGMDYTAFNDEASISSLLNSLQDLEITRLDTAARYPAFNPGQSETFIGQVLGNTNSELDFLIDTKIYTNTATDGSGDLAKDALEASVHASFQRLRLASKGNDPQDEGREANGVNILYAHRADPSTPLEEQIQNFNAQIEAGRCKAWGVSNIPPSTLEQMLDLCDLHGWTKPAVYQGAYNMITRGMETKLLPLLRKHDMHFVAFQALGGGFLSARFINGDYSGTRFDPSISALGGVAQKMFGEETLQEALRCFDGEVRKRGLTPVEVAIRWLEHHSALGEGDSVILGASRTEQLVETVGLVRRGPLPQEVLPLAEEVWEKVKGSRGEIMG